MYTFMKSVTHIRAHVKYPLTDKPDQDERGIRVEGAIFRGGLIDTGDGASVARQFEYYLDQAGRKCRLGINGEYPIQGYIMTVSYSANELDPDDPASIDKALTVVEKAMDNITRGKVLYMAVAQKDGTGKGDGRDTYGNGGVIHVHIVKCSVHTDTLEACTGRETSREIFRKQIEKAAVEMGITLDSGKSHKKRDAKRKHAQEKDGFSWIKDMEERVAKAARESKRLSEFEENLAANGVNVTRKTKSGWTYELSECEREEFIGKKARYDKFSQDFSQATLNKLFNMNYKRWAVKGEQPSAEQTDTGRQLPDISNIKSADGYDMERKDDE